MATPAESEIRGQLQRICESDTFRSAPQISRLLIFLIDATLAGQPLKESVIGASFFGRSTGYDSQADPVVRTEVRRLRLKLGEYYLREGNDAPIVIDIPPGSYKVRYTLRESAPAEVQKEPAAAPVRVRRNWRSSLLVKALAVAAVLLIAAVVWLPRVTGHSTGSARSIAVFRFRDLDGGADNAWMGSALSEMISSQLSGGGKLRAIAVDDDESNLMSVAPPDAISLRPADLARIREELGADLVVAGSYAALGTADAKQYRIRTGCPRHPHRPVGWFSHRERRWRIAVRDGFGVVRTHRLQAGMAAASSTNDLSARNVSIIQQAKALVLKANCCPIARSRIPLPSSAGGRPQARLQAWEIGPLTGLARIYAVRKDYEKSAILPPGLRNVAQIQWRRECRDSRSRSALGAKSHAHRTAKGSDRPGQSSGSGRAPPVASRFSTALECPPRCHPHLQRCQGLPRCRSLHARRPGDQCQNAPARNQREMGHALLGLGKSQAGPKTIVKR